MIEWINKLFGMHEVASIHGHMGDHMLGILHWFMTILFIGWSIFLFYVIYKFRRKKSPKANYYGVTSKFPTHIEIGVVIVDVFLLFGFAFPLWAMRADANFRPTGDDVINIRAVAEQYRWTFQYAGPDAKMGLSSHELYSGNNPVGLLVEDPNAQDDFTSINELVLPVNRPVVIQVTSKDVIHGLAILPMFTQQDAIPGSEIPMWFVPDKEGKWNIVCAQLCGAGHAQMVSQVEVVSEEKFEAWMAKQNPLAPSLKK